MYNMFSFTGLVLVLVAAKNVYGQDVQVSVDKDCYNVGDSMILTATYAGSDTYSAVVWYFSGRDSRDVIVQPSGCNVFQTDTGFPLARMTYKCPPNTADSNTYQVILSSLVESDLGSFDWGATFQVDSTSNPDVVKKQPVLCQKTTTQPPTTTPPTTTVTTQPATLSSTTSFNLSSTSPGDTNTTPEQITDSEIIYICVGVGFPLIILISICLCLRHRRNKNKNQERPKQDNSKKENELKFSGIGPSASGSNSGQNKSKNVKSSGTNVQESEKF